MGTSDRAFNQVREIIEKLDRSIDAARDRRLHKSDEGDRPRPESTGGTEAGRATPRESGGGIPKGEGPPEGGSPGAGGINGKARPLGRARPLRRNPETGGETSMWSSWGQERVG